MASSKTSSDIHGLESAVDAAVEARGEGGVTAALRHKALAAYRALTAAGPPVGRYWRVDVTKIDLDGIAIPSETGERPHSAVRREAGQAALFEQTDFRVDGIDVDPRLVEKGLAVCDFATAAREYPSLVAWAHGSAVEWETNKFAALNLAFRYGGAFVFIPKGLVVEEPIVLRYHAASSALFPYTLVIASEGSRATVVSEVDGGAFDGSFTSEIVELIAHEKSELHFAGAQRLAPGARIFSTKRAVIGQDVRLHWAVAELGASLSVSSVQSIIDKPGVETTISGIFFADGDQHMDIESDVDHRIGNTQSDTLFKSAASGRGQARYLGNIRIHAHAHGSDATLRDDALILSKTAHIDSIPALEIAANDVKAFHGATVGAIGNDEIFYAMSRGIEREEAERMITLGFFEPAIARFPTEALRSSLRESVAEKIR